MKVRKRRRERSETRSRTRWLVRLRFARSAVIEANDKDDAVEKYRELSGIVQSEHRFKARRLAAGESFPTDRFGFVTEAKEKTKKAKR